MKLNTLRRALALTMALCLLALPALTQADTYLPDGDVTHVAFTLGASLDADAFPAGKTHLADWQAFLKKLDIRGTANVLAPLTPFNRVYLDAALRLNGKDQIPFVYDGYHSYRYLVTPALGDEVFHFQMHNFLEFMLKPYYYMELPTQYLALLMYPQASYYIGESYYTPAAAALAAAKMAAQEEAQLTRAAAVAAITDALAASKAQLGAFTAQKTALETALAAGDPVTLAAVLEKYAAGDVEAGAEATARALLDSLAPQIDEAAAAQAQLQLALDAQADMTLAQLLDAVPEGYGVALAALDTATAGAQADAQADAQEAADGDDASAEDADLETAAAEPTTHIAPEVPGATTYTVPYQNLYELCETLDLTVNDDPDLERAYFYFTCLLTDLYASDMVLDVLGRMEDVLDYLDPEQQGMLVTETDTGMTCVLGDTVVFQKTVTQCTTEIHLLLPTPEGFDLAIDWVWDESGGLGATLEASAAILMDGAPSAAIRASGEGLPRKGDISGQGSIAFTVEGSSFAGTPAPATFQFDWVRDAAQLPYTLALTVSWLHPETQKPAVSLDFHGTLSASDKSVFVDVAYPQNDFFNLNESFLNEYKDRLLKPLMLKLAPILLETPAGVINDLYAFAAKTDILVSLVE